MRWFLDLLLRFFQPTTPAPPSPPAPVPPVDDWQAELLRLHNQERTTRGLAPFTWNTKLQASCQGWANRMADMNRMVHSNVGSVITFAGYSWANCGENIAWNYPDPSAVVQGWMNSRGHRANILGSYRDVAICFARRDNGFYWCAQFATPRTFASDFWSAFAPKPQLSGPLSP